MELDFIKNSDFNLQPHDLTEMVKNAVVEEYKPLTRVFKEGDDANTLGFVA